MTHKDLNYLQASTAEELLRVHEPNESREEETQPSHPKPTWLVSDEQKART